MIHGHPAIAFQAPVNIKPVFALRAEGDPSSPEIPEVPSAKTRGN